MASFFENEDENESYRDASLAAEREWYAAAAGFAAATAWLGGGRTRGWGIVVFVASLALTAYHAYAKVREGEKVREMRRRIEEAQPPSAR